MSIIQNKSFNFGFRNYRSEIEHSKSEMHKVSIITVNFNQPLLTEQLLSSIF